MGLFDRKPTEFSSTVIALVYTLISVYPFIYGYILTINYLNALTTNSLGFFILISFSSFYYLLLLFSFKYSQLASLTRKLVKSTARSIQPATFSLFITLIA